MQHHPDKQFVQYLINGLREGFDTLVRETDLPTMECKNLRSALKDPEAIDSIIATEVEKGYLRGPFKEPPFLKYRVSPIGLVEGKYSGKKRLIVDLSSPHDNPEHLSVNDLIDKESCSLTYVKIDDATKEIKRMGRGAILNKTDVTDAFKQISIRLDQHHLYCIKWKGLYYYYVRLCFGSRSSPRIFDTLSRAVCWIALHNYNIPVILHLLDDFLTIQSPDTCGFKTMALLTMIFKRLGIPISSKKTVGPTTSLEYLGIILDTSKMEARLPKDKIDRIINFIEQFLSKRSVRKRELLQLLGHFNFAARVIIPGRSFVTYLINLSTTVDKLHYYVKMSKECLEDMQMWLLFLKQWNNVSFFYNDYKTFANDIELYTDSASNYGYGAYYQGKWFSGSWPQELSAVLDSNMSMAFRELYPIVVATVLWGEMWSQKRIVFYCDNSATVDIINKGRSKVEDIMKLMRTLTWHSAKYNFIVRSEHIPGVTNTISDALSRFEFQKFRQAAPQADLLATPCPHFSDVMWNSRIQFKR